MKSVAIASWIARRPILAAMSFAVTILLAFGAGSIYPMVTSLSSERLELEKAQHQRELMKELLDENQARRRERQMVRSVTPVLSGANIAVPGGMGDAGPVSDNVLLVLVTLEVERHNDGRQICIGLRRSEAESEGSGKKLSIDMPDFLFEWIKPRFPMLVPLSSCVVNFDEARGITRNELFHDAHLIVLEQSEAVFGYYYVVTAQTLRTGKNRLVGFAGCHEVEREYLIRVRTEAADLIDQGSVRICF